MSGESVLQFCVHGTVVLLRCGVPELRPVVSRLLAALATTDIPGGFSTLEGDIHPYDEQAVSRHLSPTATRIAELSPLAELYRENERLWIVDDTWGLSEINLLRRQWRSWVLPGSSLDPVERVESALHLPMAYLLRPQGLHLLPAAAVADADCGVLMLGALSLEPELRSLRRLGLSLVAQRWLVAREDADGVALLTMPGMCAAVPTPKRPASIERSGPRWVDLSLDPMPTRHHAFCRTILLFESMRHSRASARPLGRASLQQQLRDRWPIFEPPPARNAASLIAAMSRGAIGWHVQLSRDADESARLMASLLRAEPKLKPSVHLSRPTGLAAAG